MERQIKFNQESYNRSDQYGKDTLRNFLEKHDYVLEPDKEDFQHDVVGYLNLEKQYFEVETFNRTPFTSKEDFAYDTVSFLGRKKRLHERNPFWYVIICVKTGYAVMCHSNIIYQEKYKVVMNINAQVSQGVDTLYRIPPKYCTFFKIK